MKCKFPKMGSKHYTEALIRLHLDHADAGQATAMEAYLKHKVRCLGIKTPLRRALLKAFYADQGQPGHQDWENVVHTLSTRPERELQHSGLELMYDCRKYWSPATGALIRERILYNSWWDTVDFLAIKCLSWYFLRFPDDGMALVTEFIRDDNLWLRRSALIFQNGLKKKTNEELLFAHIRQCTGIREFFIEKAIGWALREYAKINPDAVQKFVSATPMATLSRKEALKHFK